MLVIAALCGPFTMQAAAQKNSAEAEKKRLNEVRERIDKLKQNLSKSEESRTEVADQLKTSKYAANARLDGADFLTCAYEIYGAPSPQTNNLITLLSAEAAAHGFYDRPTRAVNASV